MRHQYDWWGLAGTAVERGASLRGPWESFQLLQQLSTSVPQQQDINILPNGAHVGQHEESGFPDNPLAASNGHFVTTADSPKKTLKSPGDPSVPPRPPQEHGSDELLTLVTPLPEQATHVQSSERVLGPTQRLDTPTGAWPNYATKGQEPLPQMPNSTAFANTPFAESDNATARIQRAALPEEALRTRMADSQGAVLSGTPTRVEPRVEVSGISRHDVSDGGAGAERESDGSQSSSGRKLLISNVDPLPTAVKGVDAEDEITENDHGVGAQAQPEDRMEKEGDRPSAPSSLSCHLSFSSNSTLSSKLE